MPSRLINQLQMMLHTASNTSPPPAIPHPLANNYMYANEDRISRSLICPICLDPLLDPQTHILCENSFCNRCIKKLKHCPYCRTSIMDANDLKIASHGLRNILNELQIQCNICKQFLCRGDFDRHIQNNCLEQPLLISEVEERNDRNINEDCTEKHLSNLYKRVHILENELYDLKKVIYIFLFVISTIGAIVSIGALFSFLTHSFLVVFLTIWLPSVLSTISKFLLNFSPMTIVCRLIFLTLCFFFFVYRNNPSNINVISILIYTILMLLNIVIFIVYLFINYSNMLLFLFVIILMIKKFYLQIPNNFLNQLQDQINCFFCHSSNQ